MQKGGDNKVLVQHLNNLKSKVVSGKLDGPITAWCNDVDSSVTAALKKSDDQKSDPAATYRSSAKPIIKVIVSTSLHFCVCVIRLW